MKSRSARAMTAVVVVLVAALLSACGSSSDSGSDNDGGSKSTTGSDAVLGKVDPATGTPVKVGLLSDGQNTVANNAEEVAAAKAAVAWINERQNGLAGHKIDLVVCEAQFDPAKTIDCANQLVQAKVAVAIMGGFANQEPAWKIVHDAGIPMVWAATNLQSITHDSDTSFILFNAESALVDLPLAVAKAHKSKKVFVLVVDVPAAKGNYEEGGSAPPVFKKAGIQLIEKPVALDAADLTPLLQEMANDSTNLIHIIGADTTCIAAFNAMRAVNFTGPVTTNSQCISDATRKAISGSQLKGVSLVTNAPIGVDDESTELYRAVMNTYGHNVDQGSITTATALLQLAALNVVGDTIKGDITPASVLHAFKTMPWTVLPADAGLHFRCNGKAVPAQPALCVRGSLRATLDATGHPAKFDPIGDTPIED